MMDSATAIGCGQHGSGGGRIHEQPTMGDDGSSPLRPRFQAKSMAEATTASAVTGNGMRAGTKKRRAVSRSPARSAAMPRFVSAAAVRGGVSILPYRSGPHDGCAVALRGDSRHRGAAGSAGTAWRLSQAAGRKTTGPEPGNTQFSGCPSSAVAMARRAVRGGFVPATTPARPAVARVISAAPGRSATTPWPARPTAACVKRPSAPAATRPVSASRGAPWAAATPSSGSQGTWRWHRMARSTSPTPTTTASRPSAWLRTSDDDAALHRLAETRYP
jgi:hypothetical protein